MIIINNIYNYMDETVVVTDISYDESGQESYLCTPINAYTEEQPCKSFAVPTEHVDMLKPIPMGCNGCIFHSLRDVKRRSVMEYKLYISQEAVCLYDSTVSTSKKPYRNKLPCLKACNYFKDEQLKHKLRLIDVKKARCAIVPFFENRALACSTIYQDNTDMVDSILKSEDEPWGTRELSQPLFKKTFSAFNGEKLLVIGNYPAILKSESIMQKRVSEWYEGVPPMAYEVDMADFDYGMYIYILSQYRLNVAFIDEAGKRGVFVLPAVSFLLENDKN